MAQRRTNQDRISAGSASRSVQRNPWGRNSRSGSRTSTQRSGTTGSPGWCHRAVPEQTSTRRSAPPYQPRTTKRLQRVRWSSRRRASVGRRSPTRRGRPIVRGVRGGGGANRRASRRMRVTTTTRRRTASSSSSAAKLLSATATTRRPGSQRRLQQHLPGPVGQPLVPPAPLPRAPLRRRQHGQERQRPGPPRPAQGTGTTSMRESQRRPLALTKWPWLERTGSR